MLRRLAWAAGTLLVLTAAALAVYLLGVRALTAAGLSEWVATTAAVGGTIAPALAAADAFTPLGNRERTAALRAVPREKLAGDLALSALVGGVVGGAGGALLLGPDPDGLWRVVVVSTAVLAGYVAFVARNLDVYRDGPVAGVSGGGPRP